MLKEITEKDKLLYVFLFILLFNAFVFLFQSPFNYDKDQMYNEVQRFHNSNHSLSNLWNSPNTQHPPLYFYLASFFYSHDNPRTTQIFSFICYILTLVLFFKLLKKFNFLSNKERMGLLLFFGVLPQMVIQSKFISNDTLSILLGGMLLYLVWQYLSNPTTKRGILLAIVTALGLLTKATFVMFLPGVLFILISTKITKIKFSKKHLLGIVLLFLILITLGSTKYFINAKFHDNPFTTSIEYYKNFEPQYKLGLPESSSFSSDIQIYKKMVIKLYSDFWAPEFISDIKIVHDLRKLILILSLLPTILIIIGGIRVIKNIRKIESSLERYEIFTLITVILVLGGVFFASAWSNVSTYLQSRYLLPTTFGMLILMKRGLKCLNTTNRIPYNKILESSIFGLSLIYLIYFLIVIATTIISN